MPGTVLGLGVLARGSVEVSSGPGINLLGPGRLTGLLWQRGGAVLTYSVRSSEPSSGKGKNEPQGDGGGRESGAWGRQGLR